jgi:ABC-2 type transport system permease protein
MLQPALALLEKELRHNVGSKAFLAIVVIASPLIGYSFIQAVALFSEASRSALQHAELAPGMSPLSGVVLPTIGALYLVTTLLFPFLAVRPIATEKQSGSIKLLAQGPLGWPLIVSIKGLAILIAWTLTLVPAMTAAILWLALGGHLYFPELANLFLGHALYALLVVGLSFLVASSTRSISTAAIFVLAFTIGSWVLDFSGSGIGNGFVQTLAQFSPTALLKNFEKGVFSSVGVVHFAAIAVGFLSITAILLKSGESIRKRAIQSLVAVVITLSALVVLQYFPFYKDLTEEKKNSFPAEDEVALRQVNGPFKLTVFLAADDPRLKDLNGRLFEKLKRLIPGFSIQLGTTGKTDFFGTGSSDNYGLLVYEYLGKKEQNRSTSRSEVLSTIERMTGHSAVKPSPIEYPGYPLVADAEPFAFVFYFVIPALFGALFWLLYKPRNSLRRVT